MKEKRRWVYHKDRNHPERKIRVGYIVAEVQDIHRDPPNSIQKADYKKVIQLIRVTHPRVEGKFQIRLGYYLRDAHKRGAKWRWGSQTTFQITKPRFLSLLRKAKASGII